MKLFKTSPSKFAALVASVAILGLASQSALAVGTASGTPISNTASLSYTVGGTTQTPIASSPTGNTVAGTTGTATTFVVDNKVDFTVTGGTTVNVQPLQAGNPAVAQTATANNTVLSYTVTNLGNTAQGFNLTVTNVATGVATDIFDPTLFQVFIAPGAVALFDPATAKTGAAITSLAPGATATVFVMSTIPANSAAATPAPLVNGNQALVTLTATVIPDTAVAGGSIPTVAGTIAGPLGTALAATVVPAGGNSFTAAGVAGANVNAVDVVFAEAANATTLGVTTLAQNGTNAALALNGAASANDTYNITTAVLKVQKTSTLICDPFTGSAATSNIPGAVVEWAITISNAAGSGAPANLAIVNTATTGAIVDVLNANTTFDPTKITGALVAPLCSAPTVGSAGLSYVVGAGTGPAASGAAGQLQLPAAAITAPVGAGGTLTANLAAALPVNATRLVAGDLLPGEFITVFFNVKVN